MTRAVSPPPAILASDFLSMLANARVADERRPGNF